MGMNADEEKKHMVEIICSLRSMCSFAAIVPARRSWAQRKIGHKRTQRNAKRTSAPKSDVRRYATLVTLATRDRAMKGVVSLAMKLSLVSASHSPRTGEVVGSRHPWLRRHFPHPCRSPRGTWMDVRERPAVKSVSEPMISHILCVANAYDARRITATIAHSASVRGA